MIYSGVEQNKGAQSVIYSGVEQNTGAQSVIYSGVEQNKGAQSGGTRTIFTSFGITEL